MNIFKGKKFEVRVTDDQPHSIAKHAPALANGQPDILDGPPVYKWIVTPDDINDVVVNTAITIGAVYAGARVVDTLCKIALIAAKAKF
jgi:hypothetical protein